MKIYNDLTVKGRNNTPYALLLRNQIIFNSSAVNKFNLTHGDKFGLGTESNYPDDPKIYLIYSNSKKVNKLLTFRKFKSGRPYISLGSFKSKLNSNSVRCSVENGIVDGFKCLIIEPVVKEN